VPMSVSTENSSKRLGSVSGTGRYQMWSASADAFDHHLLRGLGLGSWESWWNQRREGIGFARNAHSELFELLAETGLVGGLLFVVLLVVPLGAGAVAAFRRQQLARDRALAVPAIVAFIAALLVDWNWQLGAIVVAGMTLVAVSVSRGSGDAAPSTPARSRVPRRMLGSAALVVASLGSMAVLALALVAPQSVDASRDAARSGNVSKAAAEAARGESAAGFAASPALQRAVVEEQAGNLAAAEAAARRAAERTPDDWRPWFAVARIATARGHDDDAIDAFRRARKLNPDSSLLAP
jgi:tetratricopeptide (TPR) repeat protein